VKFRKKPEMDTQINKWFLMPLSKEAIEEAVEMQDAQQVMLELETERDFQAKVIEAAQRLGWEVQFHWSSIHSPRGYPDLTLVRGKRLLYAELKSEKGTITLAQNHWLEVLKETGKCEVYIWRPSLWESIILTLE